MAKAYIAKTREICITIGPATGKNFYGGLYAYSLCYINDKAAKNFSQSLVNGFKSNGL